MPRVYDVAGGHSVADLEDILNIAFAGASRVSFINEWAGMEVEHVWQSRHAQRVRKFAIETHGEHLIVYVVEWSDGFEKNRVKQVCGAAAAATLLLL
jgi:hypothetical protein